MADICGQQVARSTPPSTSRGQEPGREGSKSERGAIRDASQSERCVIMTLINEFQQEGTGKTWKGLSGSVTLSGQVPEGRTVGAEVLDSGRRDPGKHRCL